MKNKPDSKYIIIALMLFYASVAYGMNKNSGKAVLKGINYKSVKTIEKAQQRLDEQHVILSSLKLAQEHEHERLFLKGKLSEIKIVADITVESWQMLAATEDPEMKTALRSRMVVAAKSDLEEKFLSVFNRISPKLFNRIAALQALQVRQGIQEKAAQAKKKKAR